MNTLKRVLTVLWHLVPIILSFVRDFKRHILWGKGRSLTEVQHQQRARTLTVTLGYLGPTFIKLAQVLSARADVLPPVYIHELSTLQDQVPPNPVASIRQVIEEDLHTSLEELFESFEAVPLAAASLGQVHRAVYQGEEVAIKVLRPGVVDLVQIDLRVIFSILHLFHLFMPDSSFLRSLMTVITEFRRVIQEELNFTLEAHHVKIFQHNLQHEKFVRIPKLYDALCTQRVLVLEYMEGVKINQVAAIEAMGIDIEQLLQRLARIYIHQVMVDGFLHADPHPGNLLVDTEGRIIILDFGMVIRIDSYFKQHLIKYAIAVAHNDVDGMVHEMYALQLVEPGTNKALLRDLAVVMLEIQEQGKVSARKVQQMTNAFMNAFYEFPFTLPSELVYIMRATALIEGIGFIHDPHFDAVKVGKPVIQEMAKEILQEEAQGNILDNLQQWAMRSYQTVTAFQETILKLDREELRIHLHPVDMQTVSTVVGGAARRILFGVLALLLGMMFTAVYLRNGNIHLLLVGGTLCGMIVGYALLLPTKLRKPKQPRFLQKQLTMITSEEGEVYKSFLLSQMTPEEREQFETQYKAAHGPSSSSPTAQSGQENRQKHTP